jgi:hypothetical protein
LLILLEAVFADPVEHFRIKQIHGFAHLNALRCPLSVTLSLFAAQIVLVNGLFDKTRLLQAFR